MAIAENGDLVLAFPNCADKSLPGCIVRFFEKKNIRKWFDVPIHPETGLASPMGIAFGSDTDDYNVNIKHEMPVTMSELEPK